MIAVAWWTCALFALAGARIYERCELANDLQRIGIKQENLSTWVCIAFHESRFDTAARNPYSGDHGLLQISELYWCGSGKVCGVPCSAFRDDDISDDVKCALLIHEEHTRLQGDGFLAWVVYAQHCKHNTKKYLVDCDISSKSNTVKTFEHQQFYTYDNSNSTSEYHTKNVKPSYLSISSLLQRNHGNELIRNNYGHDERRTWLDFKVNNIDELTLPVFIKESSSTTIPITVAPNNELESKSSPEPKVSSTLSTKFPSTYHKPLPTETTTTYIYTTTLRNPSTTRSTPFTGSNIIFTTKNVKNYFSLSTTPAPISRLSTPYKELDPKFSPMSKSNIIYNAASSTLTTKFPRVHYKPLSVEAFKSTTNTLKPVSTTGVYQSPTTTVPPLILSSRSFSAPKTKDFFSLSTTPATPLSLKLSTSKLLPAPNTNTISSTHTPKFPRLDHKPLIRNTITTYKSIATSKPLSTRIYQSPTTRTPPIKFSSESLSTKNTKNHFTLSTTPAPSTSTKPSLTAYNRWISTLSTTPKSWTTNAVWNTRSSSSSTGFYSTRQPVSPVSTTIPTTKSTQSIFDLYLNPTRRPTFTYSFRPIDPRYKLNIFSDGSTRAPKSTATKFTSNIAAAAGDATRNHLRRETHHES